MDFIKSACRWWLGLHDQGRASQTWAALHVAIMKSFLHSNAKDKVLTAWQSLKMMPNESVHTYIDKFLDLYLKAIIYKCIHLAKKKQQFCAGVPDDMSEYVNSQRPKSNTIMIHQTIVASQINFQGGKKPPQGKDAGEQKGKGAQVLPRLQLQTR